MIDVSTHIAGRYRVDARLGGGGMADVFEAYDEVLDRPVAVKLLRGVDDVDAARRFAEEIRLTARVNHPNIVRLFNAGEHEGSPYLVLERVSGGTLAAAMAAGPMDQQRVATIGEQLASALSHSHAAGIVHRDVKPTNVLLTGDGDVRLADFGIAITATATRLTVAGSVAGSAGYVSPEQVLGAGAGAASDIYSLGLVLLECLVGAPPWSGTTVEVALARLSSDPAIPDTLPDGWVALLRAMTARQPEDRPPIEMAGLALSQLAAGDEPDPRMFATQDEVPQDRRIPAVAGLSTLLLLFSALFVLSTQSPPEPAVADNPALANFDLTSDFVSAVAAERAAVLAAAEADAAAEAAAVEKAERSRRKAAAERRRARQERQAARNDATEATQPQGGDDRSLVDTVSDVTSSVTGAAGSATSGGDVKLTDPAPVKQVVEDPIDSVKEAAQTLNKGKGKPDLSQAIPRKKR